MKTLDKIIKKYKSSGMDSLSDREILLLLLSYSMPIQDIADTADKLLSTFGSLSFILEQSPKFLIDTGIVDESTAVLLSIQSSLLRFCTLEAATSVQITEKNCDMLIRSLFLGHTTECFYMLSLDSENRIISIDRLSEGTFSRATIYTRPVLEIALNNNARAVILTHNHPNGASMPSDDDIKLTLNLCDAFETVNIELIDHIVITDKESVSMKNDMDIFKKRVPLSVRTKFTTSYRSI